MFGPRSWFWFRTLLPAATAAAVETDAAASTASATQNAAEAAVEESEAAGPLPPVQLGPRLFESRNQCAHWLKDLLARVPADSKLEGTNHAIVEAVLRAHHKSAEKIGWCDMIFADIETS